MKQEVFDKFQFYSKVDKTNLEKEMQQLPSRIFKVGLEKALAEEKMGKAKARLKVMKARVYVDLCKKAGDEGKRKPSEKMLEHRVAKHKEVCAIADEYETAKKDFNICWAAANALSAKEQMLTNIAYNHRKEMEVGIRSRVKDRDINEKVSNATSKERNDE